MISKDSQKPNTRRVLKISLLVFFVSALVILTFWGLIPNEIRENESGDYITFYEPVARSILNGAGIVHPDGEFATRYPPGYPILLACAFAIARFLGLSEAIVNGVLIIICMGVSSVLLYLVSVDLWGRRFAWLAPALFMTYPLVLWLVKQANSEMPFIMILFGSVYLYWLGISRQKNAWLYFWGAGILVGLAMLVRPIAIGLGVLLALVQFFSKNRKLTTRILLGFAILAGNLLVIFPWQASLYSNTGRLILLSTNAATSMRDGLTFAANTKDYRTGIFIPEDVLILQGELLSESAKMDSVSKILVVIGEHFVEQPITVAKLFLIKAARSLYATDSGRLEVPILGIQLIYTLLLLSSGILTWLHFDHSHPLSFLIGSVVVYFWFMTMLVLPIVRYLVPAISLLFIFPPGAVAYLYSRMPYQSSLAVGRKFSE